jgi:predicted membrane metal-binding protein
VLVAGLLLTVDPLAVVDPAFLLTFGATAQSSSAAPRRRAAPSTRCCATCGDVDRPAAAEAALLPVAATIFSRVTSPVSR